MRKSAKKRAQVQTNRKQLPAET